MSIEADTGGCTLILSCSVALGEDLGPLQLGRPGGAGGGLEGEDGGDWAPAFGTIGVPQALAAEDAGGMRLSHTACMPHPVGVPQPAGRPCVIDWAAGPILWPVIMPCELSELKSRAEE